MKMIGNKRRSRTEIIYKILDVIHLNGEIKVTKLMTEVNLSHGLTKNYLDLFIKNSLVIKHTYEKKHKIKNTFSLTEKGISFLKKMYVHTSQEKKLNTEMNIL